MNKFIKIKIGIVLIPIIFFSLIIGVVLLASVVSVKNDNDNVNYEYVSISADVLKYKPLVEEYCKKYDIKDQMNVILAIMMQESGGQGLDPMQASESGYNTRYPRIPNGITDPIYSIEVGVQVWASVWKEAGELKLGLQGYNFGNGYISWAKSRGGYTPENAKEFSDMMAIQNGWSAYGDVSYVEHVMRYLSSGASVGDEEFKKMMDEVLKYQGYPYRFGGETPETSFDCSGLTKWAYNSIGISLPRTAQMQYDSMTHIPLSDAKQGDLIFFKNTYSTSDYITHVGIYVGNNMMYHAGDPIGYENINTDYWQKHFVCAGRIK